MAREKSPIGAMSKDDPGNADTEADITESISHLSERCSHALERILSSAITSDADELEASLKDNRARFKVWASNIGALQPPTSTRSLDHRLRHAPLMRESVLSGLHRLLSTAARASGIIRGILTNRTVGKVSTPVYAPVYYEMPATDELTELLLSITSCLNHLFSLSILIRRQRPRGRLPTLDDYRPVEQSPDISNVMDKFPKSRQLPWLAKRLGNATTQRRQFLHYRQLHRERLAKNKNNEGVAGRDGGDSATITRTMAASTIATTFEEGDMQSHSSADGLADMAKNRISVLTSATSFLSIGENDSMGRRIPDLSDMTLDGVRLEYGKEFECPYCRTIQVASNRFEWKKHVFTDLQPYSCTFEDCNASSKLFSTRSEWFYHETTVHRRQWVCSQCSDKSRPFKTVVDLQDHFSSVHAGEITASQFPLLVEACERPIKTFGTTSCPLCTDWKPLMTEDNSKNFSRHLARHLQQLALEALPLAIDGLEIRYPDDEDYGNEIDSDESNSDATLQEEARNPQEQEKGWPDFPESKRWSPIFKVVEGSSPRQNPTTVQPLSGMEASTGGLAKVTLPVSAAILRWCFAEDKYWFVIEAVFSDGRQWELSRYYEDFYDLQIELLIGFPTEAGNTGQQRILPYMPGPVNYVTDVITEHRRHNLDAYLKKLLAMPPHISKGGLVVSFFTPREGDYLKGNRET